MTVRSETYGPVLLGRVQNAQDGALGRSKASAHALIIPPLRRAFPPFTVPSDSYVRRLAGLPGGGRDSRLAQRALRQLRLLV